MPPVYRLPQLFRTPKGTRALVPKFTPSPDDDYFVWIKRYPPYYMALGRENVTDISNTLFEMPRYDTVPDWIRNWPFILFRTPDPFSMKDTLDKYGYGEHRVLLPGHGPLRLKQGTEYNGETVTAKNEAFGPIYPWTIGCAVTGLCSSQGPTIKATKRNFVAKLIASVCLERSFRANISRWMRAGIVTPRYTKYL